MKAQVTQPSPRRIAVTLDASEAGRPMLETCARLAASLDAGLEGIFIEDSNLVRLAGLTFLRELRPASLGEESVSLQRMRHELRSLARQAERMLEQAARALDVPWSFQVWRGPAGVEPLSESLAADVLGLVRLSTRASIRRWATAGSRTHASGRALDHIGILFSTTENARRALDTAIHLARAPGTGLTVWLAAADAAENAALRAVATATLAAHGLTARFRVLAPATVPALAQLITAAGTGLLVTETDPPLFRAGGLASGLATLPCPVLLVR